MMQAGKDYGTRMMRPKTYAEIRCDQLRRRLMKANDEKPIRSVNQDKPVLHLK